jgi:hypothetical protein
MPYAKSLRVIGQSLEVARVTTFEVEKDGQDYLIRSDSLTQTGDWILRNAIGQSDFTEQSSRRSTVYRPLRFTPLDISRLDSHRQKQRRTHSSSQTQGSSKLSQLLRSLAITLIEPRSALFTFSGRLILFLSITRNPTVRVTPGRLLLKNSSNWACTSEFDGPTEARGRRLLLERVD